MCRPPGFRDANCTLGTRRRRSGVPTPARSRGPSRAAAPPENRRREGDCSVGVFGPPRDTSEEDRVQRTRAVGSGSAEHVGGTAGAQPVPQKPDPAGSRQDSFLVGHFLPPALQKEDWRRCFALHWQETAPFQTLGQPDSLIS